LFLIAHPGYEKWEEPSINAKLATDEKLIKYYIDNLDYFFERLEMEVGIDDSEDSILYFLGTKNTFNQLEKYVRKEYSNLRIVFEG
jgi:hypothetical protein